MNSRDHGTTHRAAIPLLRLIYLNSPLWIGWVVGVLTVLGAELISQTRPVQAQEPDSTTPFVTRSTQKFTDHSNILELANNDLFADDRSFLNTSSPLLSRLLDNPSLVPAQKHSSSIYWKPSGEEFEGQRSNSLVGQPLTPFHQDLTTENLDLQGQPSLAENILPIDQLITQSTLSQNLSIPDALLAQAGSTQTEPAPNPSADIRRQGSSILGTPSIQLQGVVLNEGDDFSARARAAATYPVSPNSLFGAVVDLTTGDAFSDSPLPGLRLNELYFATSPANVPNLRFVVGLMDLTSYFDRNSFAKDGASHFFNRAFQTNPALSAAGLESRVGALVNWNVTDNFELKAAGFSSSRNLGDFSLDAFAGEAGLRFGNFIVRGTYVTGRDAGRRTGFEEIFDIPRIGRSGPQRGDRENSYGINAEAFFPSLKMGVFGRYGHYENTALDAGANTYSFGLTFLDLFMRDDRLGLAYGRQLSNDDLREQRDDKIPDVLELYYDFRLTSFLRAGVTLQQRDQFSETVVGFRLKTEFDVSPRR